MTTLSARPPSTDRDRRSDRREDGGGVRRPGSQGDPHEEPTHGRSQGHADAPHYVRKHDALDHTD